MELEWHKQTRSTANKCRERKGLHGFGMFDLILEIPEQLLMWPNIGYFIGRGLLYITNPSQSHTG
jgi:hypothetical protein